MPHGKSTRAALALAAALAVAGAAAAGCRQGPAEDARTPAARPDTAAQQPRTDTDVSRSVQATYYRDEGLRARDIDVSVNDGVVTLRGSVPDDQAKRQAVQLAQGVEGVRSVNDELEVRQDAAASRRDQGTPGAAATTGRDDASAQPGWITTKIQSQYFLNPGITPWNIDVTTSSGGVVTLEGTVDSEQDRAEAVRIARGTDGVTRVDDRLRVGSEARRDAGDPDTARADRDAGPADREDRENRENRENREAGDAVAFERPDAWLTAKVQAKYFIDDEVKGRNIDVDTSNGVVTLRGAVANEAERRQAVALARSTDGVREVRDELRIDAALRENRDGDTRTGVASNVQRPDAWITTKIQAKYFIDGDVKGRRIDVETNNGVVTLRGTVETPQEKEQAEIIARETDGVRRVQNQLTVGAAATSTSR